ncbi:TPA: hypothetical protein MYO72_005464 [Citrobacter freundii]|uniref:hypothetical protein n=1 Tax=unclassified Citrobacter freundii complex TaxID=2816438 RepID=UPI000CDC199F|nr:MULTISPECIES: hypothetical protein [unclassified Citrobacter freundii complex]HCB1469550.1 hypothetical protein [Citrobacter freundii]AUZ69693.1 hypothetical protein C2U41_10210 [Citrobacter freundii complex sp. CFNIH4]POU05773.1 hypothetical protein C3368_26225 [Citrobacter freundii complex sp. CFNIH7]POU08083.1 hypothetical protein C3381_26195 [Citrobacter freundii complex sp. CFNIH6]HCB1508745.1 hypothetical protein [Citrobacter freundii]
MKVQIDEVIKKFDFEKIFERVKGDIWQFKNVTIGEPVGVIEIPDSLIEKNSAYFDLPENTIKRVILASKQRGIL